MNKFLWFDYKSALLPYLVVVSFLFPYLMNISFGTQICRHCGGGDWVLESGVKCTSLACSVFYERCKVQKELRGLASVASQTGFYPKCMVEWF